MAEAPHHANPMAETPKDGDFARYVESLSDTAGRRDAMARGTMVRPAEPDAAVDRLPGTTGAAPPDLDTLLRTLGPERALAAVGRAIGGLLILLGMLLAGYAVFGRRSPFPMIAAVAALAAGNWLRKKGGK